MKRSMREAKTHLGQSLKDNPPIDVLLGSLDMVPWNPKSSGPDCPSEFESIQDVEGLSNRALLHCGTMDNSGCGFSLEEGFEDTHVFCASHSSSPYSEEEVPQSPLFESGSNFQGGAIEIVLSFEEDLVEAQNTWNIGKALGLKVSNEKAMIDALSKVKECQDFFLPRRRGRPRKNKVCT